MPVTFPRAAEARYRRLVLRRLTALRGVLEPRVRAEAGLGRQDDAWGAVAAVRRAWLVAFPPEPADLLGIARGLDAYATGQVARAVQRLVGIDVRQLAQGRDLRPTLLGWAQATAEQIVTVESRYLDRVAELVTEAVAAGRTDLSSVLQQRYGVAKSDADRLARSEIGTLNSRITQSRQQGLGISRYRWSTSGDERVRPSHARLDGRIRSWDDPHPTEGHPGEAVNCRCVAEPVFEDEEEEDLREATR